MNRSTGVGPSFSNYSQGWNWLLLWGVALVILGVVAISAAAMTTLISVIFLGVVIFIAGLVLMIDTFKSWWTTWPAFFLHFFMALLYLFVGMMLIGDPVSSSISLTLLLGIFYFAIGLVRIIYSFYLHTQRFGYNFFSGLISLLLGILILANWPAGSLMIIGLFVGIDLLFSGLSYIMLALSAKKLLT
ncbi:MAG: DUF308 domain-containing protein [Gammaproteobacteria bacterium]|nr:DUF308 domain-containing protein [Gammaproteobacteria bacterium]